MTGRQNKKNKVVKFISIAMSVFMTLSPMVAYAEEVEDTTAKVEKEINSIENDAVKEAVEEIVSVDMSDVDNALDRVSEIVNEAITDEVVANEIEATADALINIYDEQAAAALDVLNEISKDSATAKEEMEALDAEYQEALSKAEAAQAVKDQVEADKTAKADKVSALDEATANKNRETISDSKENNNAAIDELIASLAESKKAELKKDFAVEDTVNGTDLYKFFINIVEGDTAYGCLTYYDSANKVILRKNFKISSEGIDYNYTPKAEWTKGDANCVTETFGNGGNYIAAYVANKGSYIGSDNKFKGKDVSNLMRKNVELNNNIDARNAALTELEEIKTLVKEKEAELQTAKDNAEAALEKYNDAVAIYEKVASAEAEIEKSNVEKTKLEYVKAEVEAWRQQQALNQIKETANKSDSSNKEANVVAQENIEVVVNNIARNLGVAPAEVEELVVQTIIDAEENFAGAATYEEEIVEIEEQPQEVLTLEDNEVPLAGFGYDMDGATLLNLNYLYFVVLACLALMMFVVVKKQQRN